MKRNQPFIISDDEDDDSVTIDMYENVETESDVEIVELINVEDEESVTDNRTRLSANDKLVIGKYWPSHLSNEYHKAFDDTIGRSAWYNPVNISPSTASNYPQISELRVYGDETLVPYTQIQQVEQTINVVNKNRWRIRHDIELVNFIGPVLPYERKRTRIGNTPILAKYAITNMGDLANSIQRNGQGESVLNLWNVDAQYIMPSRAYQGVMVRYSGIQYLTLPKTLLRVDNNFTSALISLRGLNLGDSVKTIGRTSFSGMNHLSSVTVPSTLRNVGEYAFWRCLRLEDIKIPRDMTKINEGAFSSCGMRQLNLYFNACKVDDMAFEDCTRLTSLTLSGNVELGDKTFRSCAKLEKVDLRGITLSQKNSKVLPSETFLSCTSLSDIMLPTTITCIGRYAFGACLALTGIRMPSSVLEIEEEAFADCTRLKEIRMPSVRTLRDRVFSNCGLNYFAGESNLKYIGREVFQRCRMTRLNLSECDIEDMDPRAIDSIIGLDIISIHTPENMEVTETSFTATVGGVPHTLRIPRGVTIINGIPTRSVLQKDVVTFRSKYHEVFEGDLTDIGPQAIILEDGITSVESYAMSGDTLTGGIKIPESVYSISPKAFYDCFNLTCLVGNSKWEDVMQRICVGCPNVSYCGSDN